jgi:hypothetical protein
VALRQHLVCDGVIVAARFVLRRERGRRGMRERHRGDHAGGHAQRLARSVLNSTGWPSLLKLMALL